MLARALTGPVPGVASGGANLLVGLTPVAPLLLDEGPVAFERGAELDRRDLRLRIQRIRAAGVLRGRVTGEQKRRHSKDNDSHSSLDIDFCAAMRAKRRAHLAGARRLSQTSESERRSVEAVRLNADRRELRKNVGRGGR
jgi:hypothetical protein